MIKLSPSILAADLSMLGSQVAEIEAGGADYIHVDVMDGHFVPNISMGPVVMDSLLNKTKLPFDVHLMITDPDKYIEKFVTENTDIITVHAEAATHLHRTIAHIKCFGVSAGVSLNPATPLEMLEYVISDVDLVLIMSVNPGFSGQKFISSSLDKIAKLAKLKEKHELKFEIQVDGGITLDNVGKVTEAGASIVVAGSAVFGADNVLEETRKWRNVLG